MSVVHEAVLITIGVFAGLLVSELDQLLRRRRSKREEQSPPPKHFIHLTMDAEPFRQSMRRFYIVQSNERPPSRDPAPGSHRGFPSAQGRHRAIGK